MLAGNARLLHMLPTPLSEAGIVKSSEHLFCNPHIPSAQGVTLCRGCDAVAPVIHEWTYEAMAYDLLGLKGSTFKYESETAGGKMETKEHILDERDELWVGACSLVCTCPCDLPQALRSTGGSGTTSYRQTRKTTALRQCAKCLMCLS